MEHDDPEQRGRFLALIETELGALTARMLPLGAPEPQAINTISCRLDDGRLVIAVFAEPPDDLERTAQRLGRLVEAISTPEGLAAHHARISVPRSLKDELYQLSVRSGAADALVIDANSPVIWGRAFGDAFAPPRPEVSSAMLVEQPSPDWSDGDEAENLPSASDDEHEPVDAAARRACVERALDEVRALEGIAGLLRGKPLRLRHQHDECGYVVHSFSSIYLLIIVFSGRFDELRAERALLEALPRIEELVTALPPLDPEPAPMAGVIRFSRRRR